MPRYHVLIPAAGSGSRIGAELPKQYLPLVGKPLIQHTLGLFCQHPAMSAIYVVLGAHDTHWQAYPDPRVKVLRCGGESRAQTVLNGLQAMAAAVTEQDWVLVHDAARPCLSIALLDKLINECADDPVGGLLAVPVADTLKRAGPDGRVTNTEPRAELWRAQTPQMFRYHMLREALTASRDVAPTDEAQAMEWLGYAPRLVLGDGHNLKVTYPEDIVMAELILKENRI